MSYYKLIHGHEIVDAIDGNDATWLVENPRSLSIYAGAESEARGVVSTDGQTTWHIEGREAFTDYPHYETAQLIEIDAEEYAALRAELDAGNAPEEEMTRPEDATDTPEPEALPKTRLRHLEELVASLSADNEMLKECLLEMSEVVYA